ncbi:MAG: NAD(P)-dependent oxidoreductase [archaeon]|nr:NAD(P)-dependent oxidoreductase [archaeon]
MIVGFIGFGRVSKRLNELFTSVNIETVTSDENRFIETRERIKESNIKTLNTNLEVANISDILISANSPSQALDVALNYGNECKGIFIDLNNISPETTLKIANNTRNFIDAAIIGKIEREKPILFYCGERWECIDELPLDIHYISDKIGDVSKLKLLRSTYTKSLAGVLIESIELARKNNLEEEFLDILSITEGKDFKESSLSRINNTFKNTTRKEEEIEEILNYFSDSDLIILKSVLDKFKKL